MRFDYANLLADMGKNSEALEQYNLYAASFPQDGRVYQNLGLVYKRLKNYNLAILNYEKAVALNVATVDTKKDLAACYHIQKDYAKAILYYDQVLAVDDKDYDVKLNKAIALHATHKYQDAINLYEEVSAAKPSDIAQNNLTEALIALGNEDLKAQNYSKATDEFVKAISRGTKDSKAYIGLARAYRACKVNDKATEYYEKAVSLDPEKTAYSNEFAEFIAEVNKVEEAQQKGLPNLSTSDELDAISLTLSEEEKPAVNLTNSVQAAAEETKVNNTTDLEKSKELITLGDDSYKKHKYDDSIKNYKAALKINPSDEVTLLKIGNVYKLKNDEKNAVDFYKKAIFVNPAYADGWFNLGLVYANQKNVEESKKCFQHVISLNPEYAYAYYALGLAYETEKNTTDALKNYELFLKYNKDTKVSNDVEQKIKTLQK